MKPHPFLRTFGQAAGLSMAAALLSIQSLTAQTIPNPSFETDTFTVYPGYVSLNTAITGWTGAPTSRIGLNPAGTSPFADNGTIPAGNNVAFIQANVDDPTTPTYLSTTVSGLTVGTTYKITFRANARGGNTPNVKVYLDDVPVWQAIGVDGFSTAAVAGSSPYWYVAFEFQATAASQVLKILNDATGDQTLLLDDFQIAVSSGKWTVAGWTDDSNCGINSDYLYTHAYNFNTSGNATINGVTFTGVAGGSPAVSGKFSSTYLGNAYSGDVNAIAGDSAALAANFVYGGNVPAGQFQSVTMEGLTVGTEYVVTIFTVAWENPAVGARWGIFNVNDDRLTVNQDMFFDNFGITISYRYTATASTQTIQFAPFVPQNVSFHVYAFANREAVSRFVAPLITTQPKSQIVSPDLAVAFNVVATGVPVPTYQWRFNGTPITDATSNVYTVTASSSATAGNYDCVLSNRAGVVTSAVARLTVGLPMTNPSFEADVFTVFPGYVSGNGPITGWTALDGHGLNPASGSPFANNGNIPNGAQVAFMQAAGAMSQTVSGLTVGNQYCVHYFENMRSGYAIPGIEVTMGGTTIVPAHDVTAVGTGDYHEIFSQVFTATSSAMDLAFVKSSPYGGDATAVIDNVAIVPVASGTAPTIGVQPQPASVTIYIGGSAKFMALAQGSLPLTYQWRLNGVAIPNATDTTLSITNARITDEGVYTLVVTNNFGAATSAVAQLSILEKITSFHNTGIAADGSSLAAGTSDPFWTLITNPDGGSSNAIVSSDAWPVGTWMNNSASSRWIGPRADLSGADIAGGDYLYRTTFDLTGRDISTVVIYGRWTSDNAGTTVFLNGAASAAAITSGDFANWTYFTLTTNNATFLQGTNTLDFGVNNAGPGPTGVRVEFVQVTAKTLPGIAAGIGKEPAGGDYNEGDTVTMSVTATGTLPIGYQWKKNGANIAGQTTDTLTIASVTTNDIGTYTVLVSNYWGTALSSGAVVTVSYRAIPGAFGTGLSAAGALLNDGETDPHYAMSVSPDPNFPGPDALAINAVWPIQAGVWALNGPKSRWIGPQADQSVGNAFGDYTYQTTVDLTGQDLSKVVLKGAGAADNGITDILVNGVSSGVAIAGFGGLVPFAITNGLVAGTNTLDIMVNNAGTADNPTGLRLDLQAYVKLAAPAVPPTLTITRSGSSVTISWTPTASGQKLLWASDLNGAWTEISGATSPYTVPATAKQVFYRVAQ